MPSWSTICDYFLNNLTMLLFFALCPFMKMMRHGKMDLLLTVRGTVDFTKKKIVGCV